MSRLYLLALLMAVGLGLAGCGGSDGGSAATAATVNGQTISMASYNKQVSYEREAAKNNYNFDVCSSKETAPVCAEVKKTALNDLIGNALVDQYAARHHLSVTDAEFARRWAVIDKAKFHNDARVAAAYAQSYGWTVADLKASIRHDILQQKVMYAVTQNMSAVAPAVKMSKIDVSTAKEAHFVQRRLHAGETFQQIVTVLAKNKQSLCHSPGNCGEMAWLPTAFLPATDAKAKTAAPGTVLGPVIGQRLFEFLRVKAHNPNYHMTTSEQFHYRQLLFSSWLTRQQKRASISRHVQV